LLKCDEKDVSQGFDRRLGVIRLLLALFVSAWIGGIAILSVQNATAVSLKFLFFQSIQMPLGVLLAFAVMAGLMGAVMLLPLLQLRSSRSFKADQRSTAANPRRKNKSDKIKADQAKSKARAGNSP
jgi:uncharacterized integral membrane protein